MKTSSIARILVSVSDLDKSLAFYRDYAGLKVQSEEDLTPEEVNGLYQLPPETTAHAVHLSNTRQTLIVELIQFKPHGIPIRKGGRDWDYGIYDICFFVEGVDSIYRSLMEKGYASVHEPVEYNPSGNPVKETVIIGPDNAHLAHLQRVVTGKELPGRYISIADSAQIVPDVGEAVNFYTGIAGLDLSNRITLPRGTLDNIIGVPKGTRAELAFINRQGSKEPMVVAIGLSAPGKHLTGIARPPNLGIFGLAFEVANISIMLNTVRGAGYKVISGPFDFHKSVHGMIRAITVSAPAGVMVEFFERWPSQSK
jgi:catechol 2,3-dioxygenase-like lactoylglutathione lyase family enzyme